MATASDSDSRPEAVIYTRISRDREGESVGVKRQESECRELAARHNLDVVHVYTDNDISASTLSRKDRPDYEQMLEDIRQGRIQVVLAYSNSRLTRRPMELESLIKLHDQTKVVFKTVVSGEDDLSTADGRMVARIKASVDAAEAERTSERLRSKHRQLVLSGRPFLGGSRAFGWEADKITIIPAEAELIRSAVRAVVHDGSSFSSVADTWNALGLTTTKGNEWTHKSTKDVLTSPRLAGYRVYQGRIATEASGEPIVGPWEPILSDEEWFGVKQEVESRKKTRRRPSKFLLSRFLICGRCGSKMYGTVATQNAPHYKCARSWHLSMNLHLAEEVVGDKVGLRIAKVYRYTSTHKEHTPQVEPYENEGRIRELQEQNEELMASYNSGGLKASRVFPMVERNDQEIEELLAERRAWMAEQKRKQSRVPKFGEFDLSLWTGLSDESREALTVMALEKVIIKPTGKNRSVPASERVSILWSPSFTPWPEGEEPDDHPADVAWMARHRSPPSIPRIEPSERVQETIQLLSANPDLVGREVAEQLKVSRPYAQKLLREAKNAIQQASE